MIHPSSISNAQTYRSRINDNGINLTPDCTPGNNRYRDLPSKDRFQEDFHYRRVEVAPSHSLILSFNSDPSRASWMGFEILFPVKARQVKPISIGLSSTNRIGRWRSFILASPGKMLPLLQAYYPPTLFFPPHPLDGFAHQRQPYPRARVIFILTKPLKNFRNAVVVLHIEANPIIFDLHQAGMAGFLSPNLDCQGNNIPGSSSILEMTIRVTASMPIHRITWRSRAFSVRSSSGNIGGFKYLSTTLA